jgi:hypothetical protein
MHRKAGVVVEIYEALRIRAAANAARYSLQLRYQAIQRVNELTMQYN